MNTTKDFLNFNFPAKPIQTEDTPYDGSGWPGDGSGIDDFEDYNQSEQLDYLNE